MTENAPIPLDSHSYWGKRSGTNHPVKGKIIQGKKGSAHHQEHQGPHGKQLRWYPGRALKRRLGKHGIRRQQSTR